MRKISIILVSIALAGTAQAQITFQKTYGGASSDDGYSVKQTTDGGYIIAGETASFGAGDYDFYLIKTDSTGDTLWTKTYGSINREEGFSVQQTTDGGYIIAGSSTVNSPAGYLIKTNNYGDTLWTKGIAGAWDANSIKQTSDGGYIIAGNYRSGYVNYTLYLTKIDSTGTSLWTEKISTVPNQNFGYPDVQQTTDGGYIVLCDAWYSGACLVKTDAVGNVLWIKIYEGQGCSAVQQTNDNGYIITGCTTVSPRDIFLIKTDSSGSVVWSKNYDDKGDDVGMSVRQTTDGGYVIAGYTNGLSSDGVYDICLVKTDDGGNLLWSKTYVDTAGDEDANSVQQTADGGYVIAGYTNSFGAGYDDFYLIKTDSLGNSGCNDVNPATTTTSPFIPVTDLPLSVIFLDSTDIPLITTTGGGGVVTTLCIVTGTDEIRGNTPNNSISISPNPFSNSTTISFSLSKSQKVSLKIFDVSGRLVATVSNEIFEAGENKLVWNAADLIAGIYFLQFQSAENLQTEKLIVTK